MTAQWVIILLKFVISFDQKMFSSKTMQYTLADTLFVFIASFVFFLRIKFMVYDFIILAVSVHSSTLLMNALKYKHTFVIVNSLTVPTTDQKSQ